MSTQKQLTSLPGTILNKQRSPHYYTPQSFPSFHQQASLLSPHSPHAFLNNNITPSFLVTLHILLHTTFPPWHILLTASHPLHTITPLSTLTHHIPLDTTFPAVQTFSQLSTSYILEVNLLSPSTQSQ